MPDELIVTKKAELGEIMRDALAQPETTALAGGQVGLLNEDLAVWEGCPDIRASRWRPCAPTRWSLSRYPGVLAAAHPDEAVQISGGPDSYASACPAI
jgi:hypothetical protein